MEVVHLMQTVCSQLGTTIENTSMLRKAQRLAQENQVKGQRISTLYDVALALVSTVQMERLPPIMLSDLGSPGPGCEAWAGAEEAPPPGGFCGSPPDSFAAVPLVVKGEPRGVIYVDNLFLGRTISDEDIQVLTMFASNACLAMENASLYESLEGELDTVRTTP